MDEDEYKRNIPICCGLQTVKGHIEYLMLCWSITNGFIKNRGVEGPQYCHNCDVSIRAKRLSRKGFYRFQPKKEV